MVPITQCPTSDMLRHYAERGATTAELQDLFGHLEHCSECVAKLEAHFAGSPLVRALGSGAAVPPPQSAALTGLMERLRGLRPAAAVAVDNEETIAPMRKNCRREVRMSSISTPNRRRTNHRVTEITEENR